MRRRSGAPSGSLTLLRSLRSDHSTSSRTARSASNSSSVCSPMCPILNDPAFSGPYPAATVYPRAAARETTSGPVRPPGSMMTVTHGDRLPFRRQHAPRLPRAGGRPVHPLVRAARHPVVPPPARLHPLLHHPGQLPLEREEERHGRRVRRLPALEVLLELEEVEVEAAVLDLPGAGERPLRGGPRARGPVAARRPSGSR